MRGRHGGRQAGRHKENKHKTLFILTTIMTTEDELWKEKFQ